MRSPVPASENRLLVAIPGCNFKTAAIVHRRDFHRSDSVATKLHKLRPEETRVDPVGQVPPFPFPAHPRRKAEEQEPILTGSCSIAGCGTEEFSDSQFSQFNRYGKSRRPCICSRISCRSLDVIGHDLFHSPPGDDYGIAPADLKFQRYGSR